MTYSAIQPLDIPYTEDLSVEYNESFNKCEGKKLATREWHQLSETDRAEIAQLDRCGDISCFLIDKHMGTFTKETNMIQGERPDHGLSFANIAQPDDVTTFDEKVYDPTKERFRSRNNARSK